MEENSKTWHAEVISAEVADTAGRLTGLEALRDFYLAGGTALALHLGHRRSVDLDFFSADPFNQDLLVATLQALPEFSLVAKSTQTLHLNVSGTKVSFIGYSYPLLFPLELFRGLAVADVRDIACMKLSALASRGSRRDFIDLYVAAQRLRTSATPRILSTEIRGGQLQRHSCAKISRLLCGCRERTDAGHASSAVLGRSESVLSSRSTQPPPFVGTPLRYWHSRYSTCQRDLK